jgi:Flp pilus assembly protein TadD
MELLRGTVEGRDTVRALKGRLKAEPKNPEVRLKLARKHQERHQREEALSLLREAASLDPKGIIKTRADDGASVSCREMAEFQIARTYVVTWGTFESDWMRQFIRSHPASPLLREAYLQAGRFSNLSDSQERSFYGEILDRFPRDPEVLAKLGEGVRRLPQNQESLPFFDAAAGYAEKTFESLQQFSPADAAKTLAELNAAKGDGARAESAFGPGFISGQKRAWARSLLDYADFWMLRKRNETDALAAARLALALCADDAGVRRSAARLFLLDPPRTEEALGAYGPAWAAETGRTAQELYDYFSFWMGNKSNRESALAALDVLLAKAPDVLDFRASAARVLWKADEKDKTLAVFGPEYAASHSGRLAHLFEYGLFWIPRGANLDTAVPALVKAASEPVISWTNKWRAAELLDKSGRKAEAESIFDPACLEYMAGDKTALGEYGRFWAARKTNPQTVLQAMALLEKSPGLEWFDRSQAAGIYLQMSRNDKAEAVYGPAYLASIPADAPKLVYYAQFWLHQRKNLNSALEAARSAVQIAPSQASGWAALADLLQVDGKIEEARQAIEKAVNLAGSQEDRDRYNQRKAEIIKAAEKKAG